MKIVPRDRKISFYDQRKAFVNKKAPNLLRDITLRVKDGQKHLWIGYWTRYGHVFDCEWIPER